MYHSLAAGVPSINLDTWLLPRNAIVELLSRAMRSADIGIIEGVMGLFDGRSGEGETGSTAELAKLLNLPVVLVIDAAKAAASVAATALGFRMFDPEVNIAGIILNKVGSAKHYDLCEEALVQRGFRVFGYLPAKSELTISERHLGLVPTVESDTAVITQKNLVSQIQATIDYRELLDIAEEVRPPLNASDSIFPLESVRPTVKIGIARDKAFSFYYEDNLALLEAWGAEIVSFSPLLDSHIPKDVSALYIGGGFPEMYAKELSANQEMLSSIKQAALKGMPIYGECGGLMYLGKQLIDMAGTAHPMVGAIPASTRLQGSKLTIGYRRIKALRDTMLLARGDVVRGHEFHWSALDNLPEKDAAYSILDVPEREEGFIVDNVLASYVHLHFATSPGLAQRFISAAKKFQAGLHA